jgi:mannosyl-3-phosphoglycerate phosphatase
MKTIIFSDLDGTLLHPETYSFEAARQALDIIKAREIPLILSSSKTHREVELYRNRLGNDDPFITENGGAVFVPVGYFSSEVSCKGERQGNFIITAMGRPYAAIRRELIALRKRLEVPVIGFGDMTVEEVSALTGLPRDQAALSRDRDFSEPFLFEQGTDEGFLKALSASGLRWTRGRLYCLMGDHDKGAGVRLLKMCYKQEYGTVRTIGIGDAWNDLPLLQEADDCVLVQKQDGSYDQKVDLSGLIRADGVGPEGWNKAVLALLQG